jgi:hypothetical protein
MMPSVFSSPRSTLTIFVLSVWGVNYFKRGTFATTLRRVWIVALLLFTYFVTEAMVAYGYLESTTPIDDVLGTLFMVALLYVAYGFVNDWKNLSK